MLPSRDSVKTVAALHEADDTARLLIVQIRPTITVLLNRTFAPNELGQSPQLLTKSLDQYNTDLLLRLIPCSRTIARTTTLPDSADPTADAPDDSTLARAVALVAEGELPVALPSYRRAAGMIQPGSKPTPTSRRPILLTGWPVRDDESAWRAQWPGPQVGVSEIAALAHLARLSRGVRLAAVLNASARAVGVIAAGPEKTLVRVAKLDAAADPVRAARAICTETARAAGVDPADTSFAAPLELHDSNGPLQPRVLGSQRDSAWSQSYALAAAAIELYADSSPLTHGLAALYQIAPTTKPPVLARLTQWFGSPVRAAALLALCLAAFVGSTLIADYAKARALEKSIGDEAALTRRTQAAERDVSFYKLLADKRWPMTKLLADIASATPVGIVVESLEMAPGEAISIRAKAETSELITTFRENLNKLRIFENVQTPSTSPVDGGVQFQLTARVQAGRAIAETKPVDDFAASPLIVRMYGESARSAAGKHASAPPRSSVSRDRQRPQSGSTNRSTQQPARAGTAANARDAKPPEIPPALSDADIAKMDANKAMLEWARRQSASRQPGLDDATKQRLTDEAAKARQRMQQARQQAGGSS